MEGWRDQALEGIGQALRQGTGKSGRELELERDLASLEKAFTHLAIKHDLSEDQLYTPSPIGVRMMGELDDLVQVKAFFTGDVKLGVSVSAPTSVTAGVPICTQE